MLKYLLQKLEARTRNSFGHKESGDMDSTRESTTLEEIKSWRVFYLSSRTCICPYPVIVSLQCPIPLAVPDSRLMMLGATFSPTESETCRKAWADEWGGAISRPAALTASNEQQSGLVFQGGCVSIFTQTLASIISQAFWNEGAMGVHHPTCQGEADGLMELSDLCGWVCSV